MKLTYNELVLGKYKVYLGDDTWESIENVNDFDNRIIRRFIYKRKDTNPKRQRFYATYICRMIDSDEYSLIPVIADVNIHYLLSTQIKSFVPATFDEFNKPLQFVNFMDDKLYQTMLGIYNLNGIKYRQLVKSDIKYFE